METLVLSQHRNRYCTRNRAQIVASDGFGSPSSMGFQKINCRAFQSASSPGGVAGILPSHRAQKPSSSKTVAISPPPDEKLLKSGSKSSAALPIAIKTPNGVLSGEDRYLSSWTVVDDDPSSYTELWAGPAYSNSPPPSSLPIPKFSLPPKRSISLEISPSPSCVKIRPVPKSAPSSPTRDSPLFAKDFFIYSTASATESLRRILHLEVTDD